MSLGREPDPPIELSTTRIAGGGSARLVAIGALGLLVGVVAVGLSGRPAPAAPRAPDPPTDSSQLSPPPARLPAPEPWQARTVGRIRLHPQNAAGADAFGVIVNLGGRDYPAVLDEIEPGHLSAMYRMPFPRPATQGTLALAQLWTRDARRNHVFMGSWVVPLDPLMPETRRAGDVVDVTIAARPKMLGVPRLVTRGYRLRVRAESRLNSGVLAIDVWLGPGRQLVGNDGIFGWPAVAQARNLQPPRGTGLYNRCRWDLGPQAAPPRPLSDEADC